MLIMLKNLLNFSLFRIVFIRILIIIRYRLDIFLYLTYSILRFVNIL